ncbi:DeoR/GlpR family DNA-binding transcription regulator [Azospirillum picis]|uniref:DeoR/GlpR family transcriptional regulator of sugar metabolism n=1 Tax=Azospirillum picis TaxID=488438 RepID=A0ABU0MQJ1_9PROT|nr:DeoR/GlpR family DNA-binding transcription regulator [Azospirillum picis]MBP2302172.1 DeoR/GlpR family transcriptional regulator of sugar metabolism [Azospirillum picis]MDQ0535751.1 DeoR/GlpR family transcriptional regulator of sugar metabolism [Azospirillum picis]
MDDCDAAFRLPQQRQKLILDRLAQEGQVLAARLAEEFQTSEDTIRRDLRDLAAAGLCKRVYGGAIRLSPASTSARVRHEAMTSRTHRLGRRLAGLIVPGQFVFMDAGTTVLAAATALPDGLAITVATHDPRIATALLGREGIDLILLGGRVDPLSGAALGLHALRTAMEMRPDLLLLGTCALNAAVGIGCFGVDDAEMKRTLVRSAGAVATAVANEKLGTAAPYLVAASDALSDLVVEADAPRAALAGLQALGVRIHPADDITEDGKQ